MVLLCVMERRGNPPNSIRIPTPLGEAHALPRRLRGNREGEGVSKETMMKFQGLLSVLLLTLLASPALAQDHDFARAEVSAVVHAVHPFVWTDGMERVTPVDLVLHEPSGARTLRVYCVGSAASWRCRSRLAAMDAVVVRGDLRPLLLFNLATDEVTREPLAVAVNDFSRRR